MQTVRVSTEPYPSFCSCVVGAAAALGGQETVGHWGSWSTPRFLEVVLFFFPFLEAGPRWEQDL